MRELVTSHDGQWAAIRRGREVAILAAGQHPELARLTLESDAVDLAMVGPPATLVSVDGAVLHVHQLPLLDASARLELDQPFRIAAITGARVALVSADAKAVLVARTAGRAVTTQVLEVGSAVEFVVGLEKNQLLFGLHRKLEVWDATSGRPLLRLQLQLPPPPRTVGSALGHLWVTRPGSSEVFVYRLSDGRPFRHDAGASVRRVISHPASPMIVLVTPSGLVRLHCFAHSLLAIDAPAEAHDDGGAELALLVTDPETVTLLGLTDAPEPWRIPLGAMAPAEAAAAIAAAPNTPRAVEAAAPKAEWRDAIATYGAELARATDAVPEPPAVAIDTELGALAHRLALGTVARRALTALYALHLVGERVSLARASRLAGDWTEVLGRGELGALALLAKRRGTVRLRRAVTELLDGCAPYAVRLVGEATPVLRGGCFRIAREGRTDVEIEAALAAQLGRIAVATGPLEPALLEARIHGATLVATTPPDGRPARWPRDAGLVLVLYGAPTAWLADLPPL